MDIFAIAAIPAYLFCFVLGLMLFFRPAQAIELQRRFYLVINWRVEPVNVEREIRITRCMGIFMIVMMAAAMVLTINQL